MRKKIFSFAFKIISKHPFLIIFVFIFLGIIFFGAFKTINLKSDYIDLLPQNSESVKSIRYLSDKLKGIGQFSIVLESASKDSDSMKKYADLLYRDLLNIKEIQYINYKIPLDFITQNIFLFIETKDLETIYSRLYEKIQYELWKDTPLFIDLEGEKDKVEFNIDDIIEKYNKKRDGFLLADSEYFMPTDKSMLVLFIKPDFLPTEIDKTEILINKIKSITGNKDFKNAGKDIKISFGGTYALNYDQKTAIFKDIKNTSILALILIFFVILVFIRKIHYSVFLLFSLSIGVMSVFGLAFVVFRHINLITAFLIAILTGLDVNYGMHLLIRYDEESSGKNRLNALKTSFINTASPSFTRAVTIAVSFFALAFSRFLGFSEFGVLASFGIMMTLISTYFAVTSLLIIIAKFSKKNKKVVLKKNIDLQRAEKSDDRSIKRIVIILSSVLVMLTIIFSFGIKNIHFEYDSKNLEVKNQDSIRVTELIQEKFNISTDPAVFYTFYRNEEKDFYKTVLDLMRKENSLIGSVISVSAILPDESIQKEKIKWLKLMEKEIGTLPEKSIKDKTVKDKIDYVKKIAGDSKVLTENDLPPDFRKRMMVDTDGKTMFITQVFPKKILFDAKEMQAFVKEVKSIKSANKEYRTTGLYILYVFLIDTILKESKIFFLIVFIIIWLLVLIDLKSLKESIITLIPLILGIIWLIEIMGLFGIKFNFMNIIVLQTVLGAGVGNGVYLYHRYKSSDNLVDALKHTGYANLGMSLAIALGWASLLAARYEGLKTMGMIGSIGIITTFIASMTIMPAIIFLTERNK